MSQVQEYFHPTESRLLQAADISEVADARLLLLSDILNDIGVGVYWRLWRPIDVVWKPIDGLWRPTGGLWRPLEEQGFQKVLSAKARKSGSKKQEKAFGLPKKHGPGPKSKNIYQNKKSTLEAVEAR